MKINQIRKLQSYLWYTLLILLLANQSITVQAANPEPVGWYAGDMHVHRSCGGSPEALSSLYSKMTTNNLAAISLLADMGNGEVQNPATDLPLVNGQDASVSTPGRIVHWDAEWHWDATYNQYLHQALGGHLVALGLKEAHQIWEEYTYPVFQWARQQSGIAGFVHMQYLDNNNGIPQSLTCCTPIEYPVEIALGAADFIAEDVMSGDTTVSGMYPENAIQAYYRLLNTGFRPGLAAGTDYPCNDSRALGSLLTYVQVAGGQMTYRNWVDGIKLGRTVVSRNGHNEFLTLTVNDTATPGDDVKLTTGGTVPVSITWTANQNLTGTIELVQNGVVIASQPSSVTPSTPATLSTTVNFVNSGWLAARRMSENGHQVHTSAVFVTVAGAPVRASVADAQFYVQWMDDLIIKTSPGGVWSSYFTNSLSEAQARYLAAKAIYQQIAKEAGATPLPLAISTTFMPDGVLGVTYSSALKATGGITPYAWSITNGSLPPGLTLNSGAITGVPNISGSYNFTVQLSDTGNPQQTVTKAFSITISATGATSIWPSTVTPALTADSDNAAVELGLKFKADVSGKITGIRFYKNATNTGIHMGSLWDSNGNLLVQTTFTNETGSGWQQANFETPVTIAAGTIYVASYHTNVGHYAADTNYFATAGFDNPPLHALGNGVSGGNGVYVYGANPAFPASTYQSSNYWVDVVFTGITSSDKTPPTVTMTAPANGATVTGMSVAVSANASDNVGVAKVEFYMNSTLLSTDTSSPYSFNWNTTTVGNGNYTLMARAYDNAGNIGTSNAVAVTVTNTKASIASVQKASNITSSAQNLAVTLPSNVTVGDLIVVSVSGWPNLPASTAVTDNLGNTYSIAGTVLVSQGAYSAIYYAKNVKAGATSVTVRTVRSGGQISMAVAEFSGIDTVSPLDKTAGFVGSGNTPSSGTMTPSQAGELVIGSGTHNGNTVTAAGSGFTMIAIPTEDSDTHQPLAMEYQVLSGVQPTTATLNLSTGYTWTQNGVLFKPK